MTCEIGVCGVPRRAAYFIGGIAVRPVDGGTATDEIAEYSCDAHLPERVSSLTNGDEWDSVEITVSRLERN